MPARQCPGVPMPSDDDRLVRRPVLLAASATAISTLPVFLVGAQAVQIGDDLGLSPGSLGITVAVFFGCTALSSVRLGRAVQRWGVRRGLLATMSVCSIALMSLALSRSVAQLWLSLALAGLANGAVHPAANALLASKGARVPLGLSLGIKQGAPTAASLAAGLAVPLVAVTFGWRWSFVVGAALSLLVVAAAVRVRSEAVRPRPTSRTASGTPADRRLLVTIAIVAGCGAVAGGSIGTFLVDFGVRGVHLEEGTAGFVFAIASLAALTGRLISGWLVDQRWGPRALPLAVGLMLFGSVGHMLIGTARPVMFVLGALVAYGFGWAWTALLHFAVVSAHPDGTARATGVLMAGFATGSFAGPLILGQIAQGIGYRYIWVIASAFNIAGGLILWFMLRRTAPTSWAPPKSSNGRWNRRSAASRKRPATPCSSSGVPL